MSIHFSNNKKQVEIGTLAPIEVVRAGIQRCRDEKCEMVVSFGGGSVIDTGKAIAMLLTNGGDPLDYAEVIGRGKSVSRPSAMFIAANRLVVP